MWDALLDYQLLGFETILKSTRVLMSFVTVKRHQVCQQNSAPPLRHHTTKLRLKKHKITPSPPLQKLKCCVHCLMLNTSNRQRIANIYQFLCQIKRRQLVWVFSSPIKFMLRDLLRFNDSFFKDIYSLRVLLSESYLDKVADCKLSSFLHWLITINYHSSFLASSRWFSSSSLTLDCSPLYWKARLNANTKEKA